MHPLPHFTVTHLPLLEFRLLTTADLPALHSSCYPGQPWDNFQQRMQRSLQRQARGRGRYLAALHDGEIIGAGQLVRYGQTVEIADVIVAEAHRSQGIGSAMIELLLQMAAELNWLPVEIGVEVSNPRALALYRRLGFEEKSQIQLNSGETAVILTKS